MTRTSRTDRPSSEAAADDYEALPIAARRHPLVAQVQRQLLSRCGLKGLMGEIRMVVGVSGGADSTALLMACAAIARHGFGDDARLIPVATHVHHNLRDSADDDAAWIESLCERLGIEHHVVQIRPAELSGNLAANARTLRYEALSDVARRVGAGHVAVAHHGDDQFETILMALCRGTGLMGLSGMPWQRELDSGIRLVRPLLDSRRATCEDLCRIGLITWREDPGNLDPKSARAMVRRDVTPVLAALWPDAASRVTATSDLVQAARLSLERELEKVFGPVRNRTWQRHEFRDLPTPILAAGLRRAVLAELPEVADGIGQKQLLLAAEAIQDDEKRPREFEWTRGLKLIVTSKAVELKREG